MTRTDAGAQERTGAGRQSAAQPDPTIPPGWDYDPSDWGQRLPILALALVGFGAASYLALFQFGIIDTVWEPFFGDGSRTILTSSMSEILPIPDGALGALGYLADAVTGVIGGRGRWRRMPWLVILFGLAVGPLGAVSILLVVSQPIAFDAWCSICLVSAVISILMIGPAMDEVLASAQHVRREMARGTSGWDAILGRTGGEA